MNKGASLWSYLAKMYCVVSHSDRTVGHNGTGIFKGFSVIGKALRQWCSVKYTSAVQQAWIIALNSMLWKQQA